jgi:hypothetical protein
MKITKEEFADRILDAKSLVCKTMINLVNLKIKQGVEW